VRVSRRWKIVIGVIAGSVQCAIGIIALAWAVFVPPAAPPVTGDSAVSTGRAQATGGGGAVTGVRRPREAAGASARAERTGDATAHGP
jgi:hypothetical protein